MDLVKIKKLSDDAAAADQRGRRSSWTSRGYTVSKDVYAKTPRAEASTPERLTTDGPGGTGRFTAPDRVASDGIRGRSG